MNETLIKLFKQCFFAFGLNVGKQTRSKDVLALIRKLRPQNCGHELIRIGGGRDGGYLIPNDLEGIEYCFSPGVNVVSRFEEQLADMQISSFLADYSVDSPPVIRPEFTFDKKILGASNRGHFFTLARWKEKYLSGYTNDLILQMDIEGYEYQVILNTPDELLDQFRIIVNEFHYIEKLFDPYVYRIYSDCFEKLLQYFVVAHIHPNNYAGSVTRNGVEVPSVLEFTFLNKRRVGQMRPQTSFPHRLDEDNYSDGDRLALPVCWYS